MSSVGRLRVPLEFYTNGPERCFWGLYKTPRETKMDFFILWQGAGRDQRTMERNGKYDFLVSYVMGIA